ncbi:ATP-binding protein [Actinoplanes solisilvae]|uniref:ATP-binding protein n=1 Tax=Actinoplanes solisilvae TaxID=2486853 RepID=UPI000FD95271|nr:ATP-binding protein [Actinoplanes solisilvae]
MPGDQRWRKTRLIASAVAAVCMLVLLPISTNIATGGNVPDFLRQGWVSWTAVAVFGVIAVATYVPQAQPAPQPLPPDFYRMVDPSAGAGSEEDDDAEPSPEDSFRPLYSAPVLIDSLPPVVRGRNDLLAVLTRQWRQGGLVVLAGPGGMGKSTLARELVRRSEGEAPAWEVSAATAGGFVDGLRAVAANLTADRNESAAVGAGLPESPDHLWRLLGDAPAGWLLIVDNADDLEHLGRPGRTGGREPEPVRNSTGWIRGSGPGLVLVTSRHRDKDRWPPDATVIRVDQLDEDGAADLLLDLAPRAGSRRAAKNLAHRLGLLPLALRLAGLYLASPYTDHTSFDAYRAALDADPGFLRAIELSRDDPERLDRTVLMKTWELSLNALAQRGMPQARPTLRLLSCFAPGLPVPLALLRDRLEGFLGACVEGVEPPALRPILEGLDNLGLVSSTAGSTEGGLTGPGVRVHAVVADTSRLHLTEEPFEKLIRTTAVGLIATELDGLTADRPSAWAKFRLLTPHLQALLLNSAPRLPDPALTTLAGTTSSVAGAYGYMGRAELGIMLLTWLLKARRTWTGPVAETRLGARQHLANLLDPAAAERIWREILTIRLGHWPADSPLVLAARHNILEVRSRRLPWSEVQPSFQALLEAEEVSLGPDFRVTLATRQVIAVRVGAAGDWPAAEDLLRRLAADAVEAYGGNDLVALVARRNYHTLLRHRKRLAEADGDDRRLHDDLRKTLGADHILSGRHFGADDFVVLSVISSPYLNNELAAMTLRKVIAMAETNPKAALEAFDALIKRFGDDTTPGIVETVADGMFQKALLLGKNDKVRDSVAVYDELIGRYDGKDSPVLRVLVAHSFNNKAISAAWDPDQSVDAAEQASIRYQRLGAEDPDNFSELAAKAPRLAEQIRASAPAAMLDFAKQAARLEQWDEALEVLDRFITRYGEEESPKLRQLVAQAMLLRATILGRSENGDGPA